MARQIKDSDFVLMVCTETYARRVEENEEPGKGHGVLWESNLIYNAIYAAGTINPKFLPVLFHSRDEEPIPLPLASVTHYCVEDETGYQKLYRRLTNQPRIVKPLIGEVQPLPPDKAASALGKLVNVPNLPPHFLGRHVHLEAIKAAVLDPREGSVGVTGAGATGVQGMGGIGKTVLAAAVAHDPDVRRAFRDGTYWLRVGRELNLLELQNQLLRQVAGPQKALTTSQEVKGALRKALDGWRALIVLDDVWQADHAYELWESCAPARLLITTRDAEVLVAIGAAEHRVDVLSPDDALAMLAKWTGEKVDMLPPQAAEVAKECGYLPLALAAVGAMIRGRPSGWQDALARLRSADLDTIRQVYRGYPYPNLMGALEVSIDALEESDRERYLDLAVFPEDQPIPEGTLGQLWGLDPLATRDCMARFIGRSLAASTAGEGEALVLHDLLRDVIRKRRQTMLPHAHARLLQAWDSALRLLDRYAWRWVAYYLVQAKREDDLRRLLSDLNYLQAKLDATDVNALLADYDYLSSDADLRTIQSAIRLSAHILSNDKGQLAAQLRGRLLQDPSSRVQSVLDQALRPPFRYRLLPLIASLNPAKDSLLPPLEGHTRLVSSIAITADGHRAMFGSNDGSLCTWLLGSGQSELLEGHKNWVWSVALSADGHRAVSGSGDRTLRVWNLETRQSQLLYGHTDWVRSVALTPDGHRVVSGSADKTLHVWDLADGQSESLEGHTASVLSVAVTGDGNFVVSGSADRTLRVWDLVSGQSEVLIGHTDWVRSVAVAVNGYRAVSGSDDRTVRVWDLVSGKSEALIGHTDWVRSVALTPDGRRAVSGSADNTLRVWDPVNYKQSAIFTADTGITCCAVTPDGRTIVAGDISGRVHILRYTEPDPNAPPPADPPFRLLGSS